MTHTLKRTFAMLLLAIFGSAFFITVNRIRMLLENSYLMDAAQGTDLFLLLPIISIIIRSDASD
jgi:hypothetical protein